ncbi:MAG: DUF5309 family protein [Bacteroidales bacterium]|nr:DUF5309 family protein [Bacteroidales bacterium]
MINNQPTTTTAIAQESPELLRNAIDQRITKIMPTSTPIDQLSRCAMPRHAGAMTVDYYSVDTRPTGTVTTAAVANGAGTRNGEIYTLNIQTADNSIFDASETVLVPDVKGGNGQPLMLYVVKVNDNGVVMSPVNGVTVNGSGPDPLFFPAIPVGSRIERMGRAAAELDVQTGQFACVPRKERNNCQIFKMQVETSTLAKMANKEVSWSFSDQEEAAVIDMRLGMEKSFLFGQKAVITDPEKKQPVFFTQGIWSQAGKEFELEFGSGMNENKLIAMAAHVFANGAGSKRKIMVAGTKLIEEINKITVKRCVNGDESFTRWGIQFREVVTNFGSIFIVHSEVFDQCGHAADGIVLDPDYITKYVHIPFRADTLDLRASGQRNTDAVVLTEASCLVLRYPNAHCRIIGKKSQN